MPSTHQPKISVILPFYNEGHEFEQAIESVLQQSFSDFELILVNNNATEKATEIAKRKADKDDRIVLLEEKQQGISFALNKGLTHSRGKYIARMDGDDICMPQRLKKQFDFLENNKDYDVVSAQAQFTSSLDKNEGYSLFVEWQNAIISAKDHELHAFIESPLAHPSVMYRTKLIEQFGGYSEEDVPEDYELWLRWLNEGVKFYKLPEILIHWHDHPSRLSRNHSNYSKEAFYRIKSHYLAKWIKKNISSSKKIVICGSSKICRKRAALLENHGILIYGYTDVSLKRQKQSDFVQIKDLQFPNDWFLINFISKRGVGDEIRKYFSGKGFIEGIDFIMGG